MGEMRDPLVTPDEKTVAMLASIRDQMAEFMTHECMTDAEVDEWLREFQSSNTLREMDVIFTCSGEPVIIDTDEDDVEVLVQALRHKTHLLGRVKCHLVPDMSTFRKFTREEALAAVDVSIARVELDARESMQRMADFMDQIKETGTGLVALVESVVRMLGLITGDDGDDD